MKYHFGVLLVFCFMHFSGSAQKIILEGKQTINKKTSTPVLACVPVKLIKTMKIVKVSGNCKDFWIQKGSKTVYKFNNFKDPIGKILSPGIYYIYPNIKPHTQKADVSIILNGVNNSYVSPTKQH